MHMHTRCLQWAEGDGEGNNSAMSRDSARERDFESIRRYNALVKKREEEQASGRLLGSEHQRSRHPPLSNHLYMTSYCVRRTGRGCGSRMKGTRARRRRGRGRKGKRRRPKALRLVLLACNKRRRAVAAAVVVGIEAAAGAGTEEAAVRAAVAGAEAEEGEAARAMVVGVGVAVAAGI